MGDSNSSSPTPRLDLQASLPNPELTTVLGEDWTSPKVQQVARESHGEDAKVHGQDGEQDQEFGEESFWFFKQEEVQGPTSLGVGHSSPPKGGSLPKSLTEPLLSSQGKENNTQRRRKSSKARRSSSTTGLDRVQTEETQLDRADGRVDLEEPQFEILDSNTINPVPGLLRPGPLQPFERAQLHQGQGSHTTLKMKKRGRGATSSIE
ncbi:unnamed protein product [Microthlaspi erraticum]|uniref:Uncharacterized protein n=1 Tax=Microthlaspi erraticum TaxID=1685480 RepID=A0A6D2JX99_9BRAS|nr:unnamed protein product [Microthlaspi erraticum]